MTVPASPEATDASVARRAAAPSEPVSSVTRVAWSAESSSPARPIGPSRSATARWCCAASTSVGASRAACPPASTTWSIARSAQTVLPEPTSPCSSRCMGCGADRSVEMSAPTARWPSVSWYGSVASNPSSSPPPARGRGTAGQSSARSLRWTRLTCTANASSHLSRRRAAALPLAAALGPLAGEQPPPAGPQIALAPGLVEERQPESPAGAVADGDLQQLAAARPHRPQVGALHLGHDGDLLAHCQRADVGVLAALVIPARKVVQQVTDGLHPPGAG